MKIQKRFLKALLTLQLFSGYIIAKDPYKKQDNEEHVNHQKQEDHTPLDQEAKQAIIGQLLQDIHIQTDTIQFCLQQIEHIAHAGKIKFDENKYKKSQFLDEIKHIKDSIEFMYKHFTTQLPPEIAIEQIIAMNSFIISYLTQVVTTNIFQINAQNFENYMIEQAQKRGNHPSKSHDIMTDLEHNNQALENLKKSCETIGLNTLNKLYLAFESQPLPFIKASTLQTLSALGYWTGVGLLTYCISGYYLRKNLPIWGTAIEFKPTDSQAEPQSLEKKINDTPVYPPVISMSGIDLVQATAEGAKIGVTSALSAHPQTIQQQEHQYDHAFTWKGNDGKTYRRKTMQEFFPFKEYLGDFHETQQANVAHLAQSEKNQLTQNYSLISYIHEGIIQNSNPFVAFSLGTLGYLTKNSILKAVQFSQNKWTQFVNYYLRGDVTPVQKSSHMKKASFTDMIGGAELERQARELIDYLMNPLRYERQGIIPDLGILLVGPSRTGKTFYVACLRELINEIFGEKGLIKFWSVTPDEIQEHGFEKIFFVAKHYYAPCVVFIDEIDTYGVTRDKNQNNNTQALLTHMDGLQSDPSKKVIVIAATNRPEDLDFALTQKGRFGQIIHFDYPTYEYRKAYLEKEIYKKNLNISAHIIERIAQETNGHSYQMLADIIRYALRLATYETRLVTDKDFEITLDREIRKISPQRSMSPEEKELVAIYQAGQAAARHILQTEQKVVKITVDRVAKNIKAKEGFSIIQESRDNKYLNAELLPKEQIKRDRLGYVFTMSKINNQDLIDDEAQKKELLALLAGTASLELITHKVFSEFGKEDRAKILDILERRIAQGNPITDAIRNQAIAEKDVLYKQIKTILEPHITLINLIVRELIKHTTLNQEQWERLTRKYKIAA